MTSIMIVITFLVGTLIMWGGHNLVYNRTLGVSARTGKSLSWAAQKIIKEYRLLPDESKPSMDILSVVQGLDERYGGKGEVNRHFRPQGFGSDDERLTWTRCRMYGRDSCTMNEYHDIYDEMRAINVSIEERNKAIRASAHPSADDLIGELRAERELVESMTTEVKKLL